MITLLSSNRENRSECQKVSILVSNNHCLLIKMVAELIMDKVTVTQIITKNLNKTNCVSRRCQSI